MDDYRNGRHLCVRRRCPAAERMDGLMKFQLRSKLKALPIWNPRVCSLRSTIAHLIAISEQSPMAYREIKVALDKLSDIELGNCTCFEIIDSTSEAIAFLRRKEAQSPDYRWVQGGDYIFLLCNGERAKRLGVPGVAFELVIRTGPSAWMVHRVPDPNEVFGCPTYFERTELVIHSQRPVKVRIFPRRKRGYLWRTKPGQAIDRIRVALSPMNVHHDAPRRRDTGDAVVHGVLSS